MYSDNRTYDSPVRSHLLMNFSTRFFFLSSVLHLHFYHLQTLSGSKAQARLLDSNTAASDHTDICYGSHPPQSPRIGVEQGSHLE